MKRITSSYAIALVAAASLIGMAALLSPSGIVDHFLPKAHLEYRPNLVSGFALLRLALLWDSLLLLALPLVLTLYSIRDVPLDTEPKARTTSILLVAAATALGAGLRLYCLGSGFGYDEIFVASSLLERGIPGVLARAETWRAFYALWGSLIYYVAGPSEAAARFPAFCFGVASIPTLYAVARLWVGERPAVAATFLLALSTFHVWYSQQCTAYSMTLLFALVSLGAFERVLRTDGASAWLRWGVTTFLVLYGHFYIASFLLLSQFFYLIWHVAAGKLGRGCIARYCVTVLYALAGLLTLGSVTLFISLAGLMGASPGEVRGPIGGNLLFVGRWLFQTYTVWPLQLLGALTAAAGLGLVLRRNSVLALYLCGPGLALLILFVTGAMWFLTPRYCILALVPGVVCQAVGLIAAVDALEVGLGRRLRPQLSFLLKLAVAVPFAIAAVSSLAVYYSHERYPFRPTANYLRVVKSSKDSVYFLGYGFDKFRYYFHELRQIRSPEHLRCLLSGGDRFRVVYHLERDFNRLPRDLKAAIQSDGQPEYHFVGFADQLFTEYESFVWLVEPKRE